MTAPDFPAVTDEPDSHQRKRPADSQPTATKSLELYHGANIALAGDNAGPALDVTHSKRLLAEVKEFLSHYESRTKLTVAPTPLLHDAEQNTTTPAAEEWNDSNPSKDRKLSGDAGCVGV
ncbi:hypothetical protein C8R45DRAFT_941917 [Mycena sanguinolenta]|nr:hypothetical protein C8R45DRAFT_941917 [Mycena sanguinolenta]